MMGLLQYIIWFLVVPFAVDVARGNENDVAVPVDTAEIQERHNGSVQAEIYKLTTLNPASQELQHISEVVAEYHSQRDISPATWKADIGGSTYAHTELELTSEVSCGIGEACDGRHNITNSVNLDTDSELSSNLGDSVPSDPVNSSLLTYFNQIKNSTQFKSFEKTNSSLVPNILSETSAENNTRVVPTENWKVDSDDSIAALTLLATNAPTSSELMLSGAPCGIDEVCDRKHPTMNSVNLDTDPEFSYNLSDSVPSDANNYTLSTYFNRTENGSYSESSAKTHSTLVPSILSGTSAETNTSVVPTADGKVDGDDTIPASTLLALPNASCGIGEPCGVMHPAPNSVNLERDPGVSSSLGDSVLIDAENSTSTYFYQTKNGSYSKIFTDRLENSLLLPNNLSEMSVENNSIGEIPTVDWKVNGDDGTNAPTSAEFKLSSAPCGIDEVCDRKHPTTDSDNLDTDSKFSYNLGDSVPNDPNNSTSSTYLNQTENGPHYESSANVFTDIPANSSFVPNILSKMSVENNNIGEVPTADWKVKINDSTPVPIAMELTSNVSCGTDKVCDGQYPTTNPVNLNAGKRIFITFSVSPRKHQENSTSPTNFNQIKKNYESTTKMLTVIPATPAENNSIGEVTTIDSGNVNNSDNVTSAPTSVKLELSSVPCAIDEECDGKHNSPNSINLNTDPEFLSNLDDSVSSDPESSMGFVEDNSLGQHTTASSDPREMINHVEYPGENGNSGRFTSDNQQTVTTEAITNVLWNSGAKSVFKQETTVSHVPGLWNFDHNASISVLHFKFAVTTTESSNSTNDDHRKLPDTTTESEESPMATESPWLDPTISPNHSEKISQLNPTVSNAGPGLSDTEVNAHGSFESIVGEYSVIYIAVTASSLFICILLLVILAYVKWRKQGSSFDLDKEKFHTDMNVNLEMGSVNSGHIPMPYGEYLKSSLVANGCKMRIGDEECWIVPLHQKPVADRFSPLTQDTPL